MRTATASGDYSGPFARAVCGRGGRFLRLDRRPIPHRPTTRFGPLSAQSLSPDGRGNPPDSLRVPALRFSASLAGASLLLGLHASAEYELAWCDRAGSTKSRPVGVPPASWGIGPPGDGQRRLPIRDRLRRGRDSAVSIISCGRPPTALIDLTFACAGCRRDCDRGAGCLTRTIRLGSGAIRTGGVSG